MLRIDKQELQEKFKQKDWNYVFSKVYEISDFLIHNKFKGIDLDPEDLKQECAENFYKKVIQNKIDENKNIFSFIWANSSFRIREILRKQRNRRKKVQFVSLESMFVLKEKPELFENSHENT